MNEIGWSLNYLPHLSDLGGNKFQYLHLFLQFGKVGAVKVCRFIVYCFDIIVIVAHYVFANLHVLNSIIIPFASFLTVLYCFSKAKQTFEPTELNVWNCYKVILPIKLPLHLLTIAMHSFLCFYFIQFGWTQPILPSTFPKTFQTGVYSQGMLLHHVQKNCAQRFKWQLQAYWSWTIKRIQ